MDYTSPNGNVQLTIHAYHTSTGWKPGNTVEKFAKGALSTYEDRPSFRILSMDSVFPAVKLISKYEYDGKEGRCDVRGYGLHLLQPLDSYWVNLRICTSAMDRYDEAFADKVLTSFIHKVR